MSFFTLGHSLTLLVGVLAEVSLNAYVIDAIIGLWVVYKGFDNLGGFKRVLGFQPKPEPTNSRSGSDGAGASITAGASASRQSRLTRTPNTAPVPSPSCRCRPRKKTGGRVRQA